MTPVEVLHKIVATEQSARSLYADAQEKQAGLQTLLEEEVARLREEIFARADKEVAQANADEVARADRAVEALDAELNTKLVQSYDSFKAHSGEYVERLYRTVVNADA
ncbi:MAG: hypothetical protein FWC62_05485 [Firmicutes bacterium]|nr:hypothetical protein [Bacillota bacterium]